MKHQTREEDDAVVVSFEGDIDLETSSGARRVLMDCNSRKQAVVVDLSEVQLVDSSGVASLLEALQNAKAKGQPFILANVENKVMRVLKLACLETVFDIAGSVGEALEKAARNAS